MSKKKAVSNYELLEFIKENVAMKSDMDQQFEDMTDILDNHTQQLLEIKQEIVFDRKRISRVEYRTERLLGEALPAVDGAFEDKYRGDQGVPTR